MKLKRVTNNPPFLLGIKLLLPRFALHRSQHTEDVVRHTESRLTVPQQSVYTLTVNTTLVSLKAT